MQPCMMYCTATQCSHRDTHNILSHKRNGKYGVEVGEVIPIPLEQQCTIDGCEHKETHTNTGHQCRVCDTENRSYGHSFRECTLFDHKKMEMYYEELRADVNSSGVYYKRWNGMGRQIVYRKVGRRTETFNVEYYSAEEVHDLKKFLVGCKPLRQCDEIAIES